MQNAEWTGLFTIANLAKPKPKKLNAKTQRRKDAKQTEIILCSLSLLWLIFLSFVPENNWLGTKIRWLWRLPIVILTCLLIACSTPTATPTPIAEKLDNAANAVILATATPLPVPTPTPELAAGHLVLWHSWAEAEGDALAEILTNFQQQYPKLTVDTLFVAYDDLAANYAEAVQSGGGPDLILAGNSSLRDLAEKDTVLGLDDLLPLAVQSDYWPAALDNMRWNGKLYGLPTDFKTISLFYNRSLVDANALPATTDALLALAQESRFSGVGLYASLYHLYWGFPAYGARLMDENGKVVLDQTGNPADFLRWLNAIHQLPGSYVDSDYGMLLDRFKKQEFGFLVDGPWAIDELRGALGDDLAVTLLPAGPAGPAQPWLTADGLFLNPRTAPAQQQRALLLARYLTSAESGAVLTRVARKLPANRNASVGNDAILQGFMQQAASAQALPARPEMDEVWGYGGDLLLRTLGGEEEPTTILSETVTLINEANGR